MRNDSLQSYSETFEELYDRYSDDIFRFCMVKTRNRDYALDITQESFMKFWEYLASGKSIDNHRALLYRIAGNLVIDRYRKKRDENTPDYEGYEGNSSLVHDPRERLENHLDGERAMKLLDKLPPITKEIITLRFSGNLSISEIATVVGRNSATVSVYLHRGLKKLEELITQYEEQ